MSAKIRFHDRLSRNDALLQLSSLGILVGVVAGLVVSLFRLVLEQSFPFFDSNLDAEDFESMSLGLRFVLPVVGCTLIGLVFHFLSPHVKSMGVSYVINKVHSFQGYMPIKNAVLQFFGASLALLSGGSCGREGPAIHLGATSGSALGYGMKLPNNSIRTLIACGSAAAISASFNTPIAGVIFAMEVIMMEYAISGFIPVIIASVSGAVVTRIFFGGDPVFDIASTRMNSLWEIPYVAVIGLLIGALASMFIWVHKFASGFQASDLRLRMLIVGLITGLVGLFLPEVMGMGYDTLNQVLQTNLALSFLCILLFTKLAVSGLSLGLGLPGGVIGPSLMLGGVAGSIMGLLSTTLFPAADPSFYVLLGMCAMMGATLQAPLAALMALLELSNNPNIILPAMVIIVVANLTSTEIFKTKSIFLNQFQGQAKTFGEDFSRFLNRYGVSTIVNKSFMIVDPSSDAGAWLDKAVDENVEWIVLDSESTKGDGLEVKALVKNETSLRELLSNSTFHQDVNSFKLVAVSEQATLKEALTILQAEESLYAYLYSLSTKGGVRIKGIISVDDITHSYRN